MAFNLNTMFGGMNNINEVAKKFLTEINKAIADTSETSQRFKAAAAEPVCMPWDATCEAEKRFERLFRTRMLKIAQRPQEFKSDSVESRNLNASPALWGTAGAVLEVDTELRALRFQIVPKQITEEVFWRRYFGAVMRIRREVMATEMSEESDIVHVPVHPECNLAGEEDALSVQGVYYTRGTTPASPVPVDEEMLLSGHSEADVLFLGERSEDGAFQCEDHAPASPSNSAQAACGVTPGQPAEFGCTAGAAGSTAPSTSEPTVLPFTTEQLCRLWQLFAAVAGMDSMQDVEAAYHPDGKSWPRGARLSQASSPASSSDEGADGSGDRMAGAVFDLFDPMASCGAPEGSAAPGHSSQGSPAVEARAHAARRGDLVAGVARLAAELPSPRQLPALWDEVVQEVAGYWASGRSLPGVPSCSRAVGGQDVGALQRQLALLNACILHRRSLVQMIRLGQQQEASNSPVVALNHEGVLMQREGALAPFGPGVRLQATGEPVYVPQLQPQLPIQDWEVGADGPQPSPAACRRLLSDMGAFKAANPGATLADFVHWDGATAGGGGAHRGLSRLKLGLDSWQELWAAAAPLPALRQKPLFDSTRTGEAVLEALRQLSPHSLAEQLFVVSVAGALAPASGLPQDAAAQPERLERVLGQVRDFAEAACRSPLTPVVAQQLCQVFRKLDHVLELAERERAAAEERARPALAAAPQGSVVLGMPAGATVEETDDCDDDEAVDAISLDDWTLV